MINRFVTASLQAGSRKTQPRILLAAVILVGALGRGVHAQGSAPPAAADDQKVKKDFYTPKDRLTAMSRKRRINPPIMCPMPGC